METANRDLSASSDMDIDWIIEELAAAEGKLPEKAIRAAREHRDEIIPALIDVLHSTSHEAREGMKPEGNAHFFALFLLAEFQAKEALPAIIEAVSLPGDLPFDLFGDAITTTLARVLVSLADDGPDLLDSLIRNRKLDEYVRWEAAQGYPYLVRDGHMERKEAVERLRGILRDAIDDEDVEITGPLVSVLESLFPAEAYDEIAEAYRRELVETFLIGLKDVESALERGEEGMREALDQLEPTLIEDTAEELRTWAAFREEPPSRPKLLPPKSPRLPGSISPFASPTAMQSPADDAPDEPRVGRNAPCPCGSGKKYKKCCGSRR